MGHVYSGHAMHCQVPEWDEWSRRRSQVTLIGMLDGSGSVLRISGLIARLAGTASLTPDFIRSQVGAIDLSEFPQKRLIKATIQLAKNFRVRGQFGRLRATILLGTSLFGEVFVVALERTGTLLTDEQNVEKFGRLFEGLRTEIEAANATDWNKWQERLQSYEAYRQLVITASHEQEKMIRLLRTWPRLIVKRVLALTELCFLKHYFRVEILPELNTLFEELGTPEEVASAASFLIAQANGYRPLDSADLGVPVMGSLTEPELWSLIRYGHAQSQRHDIGKQISLFGYRLERAGTAQQPLFYLRPPFAEFEYFLRLGFIRAEMATSRASLGVNRSDVDPELSLANFAEFFASRFEKQLCEVADAGKPFRRLRLMFPLDPKLYRIVAESDFYDDAADEEMLGREFLFR